LRKHLRRIALLCVPVALAMMVGSITAARAQTCAYPIPPTVTVSGTTATATFSIALGCTNVQVSAVSIVHAANPANDTIFASATGFFGPGNHTLQVAIKCGTNSEVDLVLGPPALYPPLALDLRAVAVHVDCPAPGTLTQGYWKNHPDKWPVSSVQLGAGTVTESQAIAILNTPVRGDATLILAYQLIAAELNAALGNPTSCVSSTISAANALLATYPVGSNLSSSSSAGVTATALANTLDQYNNGNLCAPHQN